MPSDFKKDKPHEENIKVSVEKILKAETILKRTAKTVEDHRRAIFYQMIDHLIAVDHRSEELDIAFMLDLSKYDEPFFITLDHALNLAFNKAQVNLIYFYCYDRITPDGFMIELQDESGRVMDLSTPEHLYEELKKHK